MDIQIITYVGAQYKTHPNCTITTLGAPQSLDEFDVNVIDLSLSSVWKNYEGSKNSITCMNHFKSLQSMVERKEKSKILFILPGNLLFEYGAHHSKILLKDMMVEFLGMLDMLLPDKQYFPRCVYENTKTRINNREFLAAFYFVDDPCLTVHTRSLKSQKSTTVSFSNEQYATTLQFEGDIERLVDFIKTTFGYHDDIPVPVWATEYIFFDDSIQKSLITEKEALIKKAQSEIACAEDKLKENQRYKSILYTNGSALVEVVQKILEEVMDCDLSSFVDVKKEDFLFQIGNHTFIGEVKGVTSNVKYEHVTQLEVHYRHYLDQLNEEGKEVNEIHLLLIINPFRTKPLEERETIHHDQIDLAKRNGSLIITTHVLLQLFECYRIGTISREKCIELLSSKTGILSADDFEH